MVKYKGRGIRRGAYEIVERAAIPWPKARPGEGYSQSSPILRLPREIRDIIYRETLGDQLLRIDLKSRSQSQWRVTIGKASSTENEEHRGDAVSTADRQALGLRGALAEETLHECCNPGHGGGKTALAPLAWESGLRFLQTCRQVYDEASPIFWSTNTFAFKSATTFELWLDQRLGSRVSSIRSLRFDVIKNDFVRHVNDGWSEVLTMGRVQRLVGLRHLRLAIYQSVPSEAYQMMKSLDLNNKWAPPTAALSSFMEGHCGWGQPGRPHLQYLKSLKKLATLPLAEVSVSVRDACQTTDSHTWWSMEERQEYARAITNALLDPHGAIIYARDIQRVAEVTRGKSFGEMEALEYLSIFNWNTRGA